MNQPINGRARPRLSLVKAGSSYSITLFVWLALVFALIWGFSPVTVVNAASLSTAPVPSEQAAASDSTPPVISVWYGNQQSFDLGTPQTWINILGNTADPESGVSGLSYTLNGSASRSLSIGPDSRRLEQPGDFNIEIGLSDSFLINGNNTVVIQARNGAGLIAQKTVQFTYSAGKAWSLPYVVDWSTVTNPQQAVQIVDGKWQLAPGGIRTVETGYDRVLAIGDMSWTNYEVLVSFTLNAIDASAYGMPISIDPGLGVNLRWLGHTNDPVTCPQPHCGWNPTGASVWEEFFSNSANNHLQLEAYPPYDVPTNPIQFQVGGTYWIRARVENNSSGSLYKAKAWADGSSEPGWMFTKQTDTTNLSHGSFLLVAHHVDMTFKTIIADAVAAKLTQTINVSQHAPAQAAYASQFTVAAQASSGLPVTYTSGSPAFCTNQGATFTIVSGSGTCLVRYQQAGDGTYYAAQDVNEQTTAVKANQTIQFGSLPSRTYGDPDFSVSASASSGLPVTFTASGTCVITSGTISITGAGTCTITASQSGNSQFNAAPDVPVQFTIVKAQAVLTLSGLEQRYDGSSKPVQVITDPPGLSGVSVTYNGSASAPINPGTYPVSAKLSNPNYQAQPVAGQLTILKLDQTIQFDPLPDLVFGAPNLSLTASASSGLPVAYQSAGTCTISSSAVTLTGAGSCTITAAQAGDSIYNAAVSVSVTFQIAKAQAVLTVSGLEQVYDGTPKAVQVTTSPAGLSGVVVSYAGSATEPVNTGTYPVTATLDNPNYQALPVSGELRIVKASQAITVVQGVPSRVLYGSQFTVSAVTGIPGASITYTSGSPHICTNQGPVFQVIGWGGSCVVQYGVMGADNYEIFPVEESASVYGRMFIPVVLK